MNYYNELLKEDNIKIVSVDGEERFIFGKMEQSGNLLLFRAMASFDDIKSIFKSNNEITLEEISHILYDDVDLPVSAIPITSIDSIYSLEPTGAIEQLEDTLRQIANDE